ncbi:uncharacterized protein N7459_005199 [Penicillium hispanicum]|uniref:uncharacterized protein n=1 Tax=Penicillium hispanicum TaxID=1080232 RepID=UPI0025409C0D|nr:uncharacterized protein N7459_005199 [Penicillium hispanicum]KAJ5585399.1 hypothetical protein N7459_005199 [Penicillium hispanicum]
MDASPSPSWTSSQSRTLAVDFTWSKFQGRVTDGTGPGSQTLYTVPTSIVQSPHLTVRSAQKDQVIGTGTIHSFSISPDYELHGAKGTLKAQKRFRTVYTHLSHAFSDTDRPVKMTWTSSSGFKTWDFICVDENQIAVARFAVNMWAVKKVGQIEILGPKAYDEAARDEIVVIGLTLVYCMWLRVNNPLNLVGSAFLHKDKE